MRLKVVANYDETVINIKDSDYTITHFEQNLEARLITNTFNEKLTEQLDLYSPHGELRPLKDIDFECDAINIAVDLMQGDSFIINQPGIINQIREILFHNYLRMEDGKSFTKSLISVLLFERDSKLVKFPMFISSNRIDFYLIDDRGNTIKRLF